MVSDRVKQADGLLRRETGRWAQKERQADGLIQRGTGLMDSERDRLVVSTRETCRSAKETTSRTNSGRKAVASLTHDTQITALKSHSQPFVPFGRLVYYAFNDFS